LEMGVSLFAQASQDCDLPILCFLSLVGWQVCTIYPVFFHWDGVRYPLPGLTSNLNPPNLSLPRS
jgi:hypothetical protein